MTIQLRFGVLTDGAELLAWQAQCIKDLIEKSGASFNTFISAGSASAAARGGALWRRLSASASKNVPELQVIDRRAMFPGVREFTCRRPTDKARQLTLSAPEYAQLRERGLGFVLSFTDHEISRELLDLPAAGVWSFQLNDVSKYDGRIPGFWEIYGGERLVKCTLVRLSDSPTGTVLLRSGTFRSVRDSYFQTVSTTLSACVAWPRLAWRDFVRNKDAARPRAAVAGAKFAGSVPSTLQVLVFKLRLGVTRLRLMFDWWLFREQWCVGIIDKPIHELLGATRVEGVKWLFSDDHRRYFADPFGIANGNEVAILAEEYPHSTCRGKISSFTVRDGKVTSAPEVVLELDGHLSYPYLFQHEGVTYCVPESNELGEVVLYRLARFPNEWTRVKTLLRGKYVDSTVIKHDGRWWLFASSMELGGVSHLYIWHAPDLLAEWTPHPCNPVKTDVCTSRPAGTPFVYEGKLYRPAQNCSVTYGGGVAINHVKRLTEDEFEEEVVTQLQPEKPGPFPRGLHTLTAVGDRTLVDGKTYLFSLGQFFGVLRSKLKRIF